MTKEGGKRIGDETTPGGRKQAEDHKQVLTVSSNWEDEIVNFGFVASQRLFRFSRFSRFFRFFRFSRYQRQK